MNQFSANSKTLETLIVFHKIYRKNYGLILQLLTRITLTPLQLKIATMCLTDLNEKQAGAIKTVFLHIYPS